TGVQTCALPTNVERALAVFNFTKRRLARVDRRLKIRREIRQPERAREIDQVSDYGACGGHLPGAGPYKHHLADCAAADKYRVVRAFDRRKRMMNRHQH